jgi:hypothetical protein
MPGPESLTRITSMSRRPPSRGRGLHVEPHAPAARVLVGVARQLAHRRGDARLVLRVEAEGLGHLPRTLAREHHVLLVADLEREQRHPRRRPPPTIDPTRAPSWRVLLQVPSPRPHHHT